MIRFASHIFLVVLLMAAGIPRRGASASSLPFGAGAPAGEAGRGPSERGPFDRGQSRAPMQAPAAPIEEEEEEHASSAEVLRHQAHAARRDGRIARFRSDSSAARPLARRGSPRHAHPPLPSFHPRLQI